jgi:hypothetical protein
VPFKRNLCAATPRLECKVPGFVEAGDRVVVNTKTGDFVRRVLTR